MQRGAFATLLFLLSRTDLSTVRPADEVDPKYGEALRGAMDAGVKVLAYRLQVNGRELTLGDPATVRRR